MLSLLLSGNQAIGAFASIVNTHRAPLIAPNSQPYCGVRQVKRRDFSRPLELLVMSLTPVLPAMPMQI